MMILGFITLIYFPLTDYDSLEEIRENLLGRIGSTEKIN